MLDQSRQWRVSPEQLFALCHAAGQIAMTYYQQSQPLDVQQKADHTPLTEADLVISAYLEKQLPALLNYPVLSEENESAQDKSYLQWPRYWLIDPIDGTRHFIARDDQFCICVALIEDGEAVFGAIYAPTSGDFFVAQKQLGAYQKTAQTKGYQRLQSRFSETFVVTVGGVRLSAPSQYLLSLLPDYQLTIRGSALKMMDLAAGKANLYPKFSNTGEWDTAAAQVILEEAGGGLWDITGNPLRYGQRETLINPHFVAYAGLSPRFIGQLLEKVYRNVFHVEVCK